MRVKKFLRYLFLACVVLSLCFVTACNRNNNGNMNDDNLNDVPNNSNNTNNGTNNGIGDNNTNNGEINDPLDPMDPDQQIDDPLNPIDPMNPDDNTNNNGANGNNGNVNDDNIVPDNNLSVTPEINSIFEAVSGAYGEDFYATSENNETFLTEKIGVDMADVESFFCNTAMDTTHPDVFVGVKAKDSAAADSVETALEDYRESLVNGMKADSSANAHKINNSEVVRHDDYVFLVALGRTDDTITDVNDAMTFAKDQVKIAVDKIAEFFK